MTTGYVEAQCVVPSSTTASVDVGGGPVSVSFTAGTYWMEDLVTHVQTAMQAQCPPGGDSWEINFADEDGFIVNITTGNATVFSITWTTAALGTLLGHTTITSQTSVNGSTAARGVWIPDRPLNCDMDPRLAPMKTDLRETESPTGAMFGIVGNAKYVHPNFRWAHVSRERTWNTDSGVTPSWERFVKDVHLGQGHSWFTPCSKIRIYDQTGALVGNTSGVTGWKMRGVREVTARKMSEAWTGAWLVEIPALVSDGT